jgi:hypothetical protein
MRAVCFGDLDGSAGRIEWGESDKQSSLLGQPARSDPQDPHIGFNAGRRFDRFAWATISGNRRNEYRRRDKHSCGGK